MHVRYPTRPHFMLLSIIPCHLSPSIIPSDQVWHDGLLRCPILFTRCTERRNSYNGTADDNHQGQLTIQLVIVQSVLDDVSVQTGWQ
jgi:hypothetical protein